MKKFLAILLCCVMLFGIAACNKDTGSSNSGDTIQNSSPPSDSSEQSDSSDQPDAAVSARDTLAIGITQDRGTLDPMYMIGYDSANAMRMIYEPLWDFDYDGNQIWVLATELEMDNPEVWHIKLREGVTFSNGNPFNADDVVFSLYRANNRTGEPATLKHLNLEETKALDEYTVELVFNQYDLAYMYSILQVVMFDVESFDEETVSTTPIGTGPYELTDYVINSHINLTLRDEYWGTMPSMKYMNFRVLAEDSQRVNALQTNTVDISVVPFQDIEYVQGLPGITVDLIPAAQAMSKALYMSPGPTSAFYDNADARKAVALAIDRQAIVDIAYSGYAAVSRCPMSMNCIDIEDRYLDLGVYGIGYDPVKAKELAESSGLAGKEILLINNGGSDSVVVAELIQADLKEIGVTVNVQSLDAGSWLSYAFDDTAYDMCVDFTGSTSMKMAQNFSVWISAHIGGSYTRNPWPGSERYLEIISTIMTMSDAAALSDLYMELTEIHVEAVPWVSLVDMQRAYAHNSELGGFQINLMGSYNLYNTFWTA